MSEVTIRSVVETTFAPMLETLSKLLDAASAFAEASGKDLVKARLVPDMYTLAQQVQVACYFAIEVFDRLGGKPAQAGTGEPETSLEGMKAQIARTLESIRNVPASALDQAEARDCSIDIPDTDMKIQMNGSDFLLRWCIPHFYFHAVTAYDILRSQGVEIGKREYLSAIAPLVRPKD